ncbi:hypothetical protein [Paraburkholderia hiiakae]|nr:hypothetical protein [Paraburkholderia hiiakae]
MKERILVTRRVFPSVIDRLREQFEVETNDGDQIYARDELRARMQG